MNKDMETIKIGHAAYTLRISSFRFDELLRENGILTIVNKFGLETIDISDYRKIIYSDKINEYQKEAFIESIKHKNNQHEQYSKENLNKQINNKIVFYKECIDTFEKVHSKYISRYDIINDETPIVAFFILFARIISLLRMTLLCLENHYLSANILLRPIDEAVSLAEYFVFSADTEDGKKHLKQWFRENKSPPNRICRDFLKKYHMKTSPDKHKDFFDNDLHSQLYYQKSKPIHSTLNDIISKYNAEINNEEIVPIGFEYGESKDLQSILGIVEFFQSSIWTSIQGFLTCALSRVDLTKEDIESLYTIHKKSLSEALERIKK